MAGQHCASSSSSTVRQLCSQSACTCLLVLGGACSQQPEPSEGAANQCLLHAGAQYLCMQSMVDELAAFATRLPNAHLRPATRPKKGAAARRWWRYAIRVTLRGTSARVLSWPQLQQVCAAFSGRTTSVTASTWTCLPQLAAKRASRNASTKPSCRHARQANALDSAALFAPAGVSLKPDVSRCTDDAGAQGVRASVHTGPAERADGRQRGDCAHGQGAGRVRHPHLPPPCARQGELCC